MMNIGIHTTSHEMHIYFQTIILFISCVFKYKVPWFDHLIPCAI